MEIWASQTFILPAETAENNNCKTNLKTVEFRRGVFTVYINDLDAEIEGFVAEFVD